jgi:nitrous oxidase accessory protein
MLRSSIIICIAFLIWLSPVDGARTYIVDDDGFANHRTIGEAVVAANNGDTIYLKPGVYNEEVLLNKTLFLMPLTGEEGPIILRGDGKETGIRIVADGCSVEGMRLENFTGPGIRVQSPGNTIKNNRFEKDNPAVLVVGSSGNSINNNIMKDCEGGVALWANAVDNIVTKNEMEGGTVSIVLRDVGRNNIIDNKAALSSIGVWIMNSSNAELAENDIESKSIGIWVFNSTAGKLINNVVSSDERGIHLMDSSGVEVTNNSVKNAEFGFIVENSSQNVITKCILDNSVRAFGLSESSGNAIAENSIFNASDTGLEVFYSNRNNIAGNRFYNCERGIIMGDSSGNVLDANDLQEVKWGLYVEGTSRDGFNNTIGESNTVNGKPIAYFYGQSGKDVSGRDLAHLTLAYCDDFAVEKNTIKNDAIFLFGSNNNLISENNVSRCYGVRLLNSSGNNISHNQIIGNRFSGLFLVSSDSNQIINNLAAENNQNGISLFDCTANVISENTADRNYEAGIWLNLSNDNQITRNNISNNPLGLQILYSSGNRIYQNNLIDNKEHAEDREGSNIWDMGNVTGGNYWSGHTAKGNPSQNWPRVVKGSVVMDNFPFQDASGWVLV